MKEFLLVRHAKSSWKNKDLRDIERPLNKRGKRDAPRMAQHLKDLKKGPDYLASSPAVRAYSTAIAFRDTFSEKLRGFEIYKDLYFGSEEDILFVIQNFDESFERPAIFSHNPTLTYTANQFGGDNVDNIPTCGVSVLISEASSWPEVTFHNTKVVSYYFPKLI